MLTALLDFFRSSGFWGRARIHHIRPDTDWGRDRDRVSSERKQ